MATEWGLDLRGHEQLMRQLHALPARLQRRVIRPAVRAAVRPVVQAARAAVPRRSGQLRRSLGARVKTYAARNVVWAGVGVRQGFGATHEGRRVNPRYYAHLVEQGVRGRSRGSYAGRQFLSRALEGSRAKITGTLVARITDGLAKEAARSA